MKQLILRHLLFFTIIALLVLWGCPLYQLTGLTCPACGVSRAWLAFLRGDWTAAVTYHPFFLVLPVLLMGIVHVKVLPSRCKKPVLYLLIIVSGIIFVWNLLRLIG